MSYAHKHTWTLMWAPPRAHMYAFDPTSQAMTTVVQPSKHNLSHHPIGEMPYYSWHEVLWKHHLLLPSNKCTLWLDRLKYRIQDRMLIPHFQIRKLLSMYASKGLSSMEFLDLICLFWNSTSHVTVQLWKLQLFTMIWSRISVHVISADLS